MSTDPVKALSDQQLEVAASALVGRIVFQFSRLDLELGSSLHAVVGAHDTDALNALIDRLTFKNKLEALCRIVERKFSEKSDLLAEFKKCHRSIDEFRSKRNSFIHGRWGIIGHAQQVVNVKPGMPGGVPQNESRFSLDELAVELDELARVANEFRALRQKWYL